MACAIPPDSPWCPLPSSFCRIVPFTVSSFVGPAGADTARRLRGRVLRRTAEPARYTTDPADASGLHRSDRRASPAGWDPAAWDSLSSAVACVRLDEDSSTTPSARRRPPPATAAPSTIRSSIPEVIAGTRLCTSIRLAGDPAGEATEAAWVTKMHCFEVDHDVEEAAAARRRDATPTTSAPGRRPRRPFRPPSPDDLREDPASDTPAAEIPGRSPRRRRLPGR